MRRKVQALHLYFGVPLRQAHEPAALAKDHDRQYAPSIAPQQFHPSTSCRSSPNRGAIARSDSAYSRADPSSEQPGYIPIFIGLLSISANACEDSTNKLVAKFRQERELPFPDHRRRKDKVLPEVACSELVLSKYSDFPHPAEEANVVYK